MCGVAALWLRQFAQLAIRIQSFHALAHALSDLRADDLDVPVGHAGVDPRGRRFRAVILSDSQL